MRRQYDNRRMMLLTDPETGVASGLPEAAMCVQDIDAQCVLQFTLVHAAGCALHRLASRVIHRLELSHSFSTQLAHCLSHELATTTIDGCPCDGLWLRSDRTLYNRHRQSRRGGRETIDGSLNLRTPALLAGTLISTSTRNRDRYPDASTGIHAHGRLSANGFHAERRPSSCTRTVRCCSRYPHTRCHR